MKARAWAGALVAAAALTAAAAATAAPLTLLTHSTSKEVRRDGQTLRGIENAGRRAFYVELVRAMLPELGIEDDRIQDTPFLRGLTMVQQRDDIVFFNVDRTPERESRVHWVGPISSDLDVLYESADRPTAIRNLDDARGKRVCVLRGNVHDRMLSQRGFTGLVRARSYTQCLQLLDAGRVDLAASAAETLRAKLAGAGIAPLRVRRTPVILMETDGYIVLSKNIPPSEVQRWNEALARLKASGRYQALYDRYVGVPGQAGQTKKVFDNVRSSE